jgi:two-component system, cell cycle sensor histidine kinase and response regulator CckA
MLRTLAILLNRSEAHLDRSQAPSARFNRPHVVSSRPPGPRDGSKVMQTRSYAKPNLINDRDRGLDPRSKGRSLRGVISFVLFLAGLTGFWSAAIPACATAASMPVLRSASEIDYPPFCLVDADGRADGFSVELLRATLAAMGRDVTFRTGPWSQVRGWLENGEVQALPLVGRTPEREALFDFTFPYMTLHGAIVVRDGTTDIANLADLKGRQVAVMKGDNAEEFLRRKDRGIRIETTPTFEQALRELGQGRYDAVVVQRLVALRLIKESGLTNLRILHQPVEGFRQDFCFAVREGDRETLALLNEGLSIVIADGTYRQLHAKWFAALELPASRRIIVGGDRNYPPYEYLDEKGEPAGYNVDLTRAIARRTGLDIEIRLGPWSAIRNALARGDIDAVQGMYYSATRNRTFDFTAPYVVNHYVAVVPKSKGPAPATLDALAGMRIVVEQGDIMHDVAVEKGLGSQVSAVASQEEALRDLARGKFDCALVSRPTALYWIKKHGWKDLSVGRHPLLSPGYCYAVPKNHQALLAEFGEGLKVLEQTGELRRINEKWMSVYAGMPVRWTTVLRQAAVVLVPLAGLLLVFFLWSWSLRHQVARRTAELRQSEAQYRLLADNTLDVIWTMDLDLRFIYVNPACRNLTGYTPEEWIGTRLPEHCGEADFARMSSIIAAEMAKGPASSGVIFETVMHTKTGAQVPVEVHGKIIHDAGGRPQMLQGVARDISERKQAEQRINHLNHVLRSIRDVNQLIARERDPETLINGCSRLMVENRGYSGALIVLTDKKDRPVTWARTGIAANPEPLGRLLEEGDLPPCCTCVISAGEAVSLNGGAPICEACPLAAPKACAQAHSLFARLVHEGTNLGYLMAALPHDLSLDGEECKLFAEMADDLAYALNALQTDAAHKQSEERRKALEGQLLQAQKMESVGRLAGGVAHDYNNMLSVIIGYAELVLGKMGPAEPMRADITQILTAAQRSVSINQQLLAFARRQTVAPKVLDLNETVGSMLTMLQRLIGEDIDLAWNPGVAVWQVKVDPAQIDQILANLCVNARDAIADVGKITIETGKVVFDAAYCADHAGFTPGEYVMLAVSDNGCGMDKVTQANIFEPFFTTKQLGRGTGLGLATVYGIVKQNEGFINVYSEPGKGTTFRIYLPRHAGEIDSDQKINVEEIPLGRGEQVLVVEDEVSILKLAERVLSDLGYRVLLANSPVEALQLAEAHPMDISLLITDVVMPEMNGRELTRRLQARFPELRYLFMSGYTANVIAHHGVLEKGVHFIQKPFSRKELALKVRTALDRK